MAEKFLININCSKILDSEASRYIMFIDSSKMSIVYELIEWIRWVFSLKNCFYLTHEDSVIHELEDIQLLSRLQNFEIKSCEQPHCVHEKTYRMLSENLNLYVAWNGMKVHKYFLDKINQMSQKLPTESTGEHNLMSDTTVHQNLINFSSESDSIKEINPEENKYYIYKSGHSLPTSVNLPVIGNMCVTDNCKSTVTGKSQSVVNLNHDTKVTEKENSLLQCNDTFCLCNISKNSENISLENKETSNSCFNKILHGEDLTKKQLTYQKSTKNHIKPRALNKPFSLGEILSNIRKDFEEKNMNITLKENISQSNSSMENRDSETKSSAAENSFLTEAKDAVKKKRQRTRKRKRSKNQNLGDDDFASYVLENKKPVYSLNISKSYCNLKPHHIRFDEDTEDNITKFECAGVPRENELQLNNEEISNTSTSEFLKNGPEELLLVLNEGSKDVSQKLVVHTSEKNGANTVECLPVSDNKITGEENVINVQDAVCDKSSQSSNSPKNYESNNFRQDLSGLLSLRDKFKNGIVIQRFY